MTGLLASAGRSCNTALMSREDAIRVLREHADEIRALGVVRLALFGSPPACDTSLMPWRRSKAIPPARALTPTPPTACCATRSNEISSAFRRPRGTFPRRQRQARGHKLARHHGARQRAAARVRSGARRANLADMDRRPCTAQGGHRGDAARDRGGALSKRLAPLSAASRAIP